MTLKILPIPEKRLKLLSLYMTEFIDKWPVKIKPFDRWVEGYIDKQIHKGQKKHLETQKRICRYCRRPFDLVEKTKDHVIPQSKGGFDRKENRVFACKDCNQWKGDKTPTEWLKEVRLLVKKEKERKPYTHAQLGLIIGNLRQVIEGMDDKRGKMGIYKLK